ncbi:unnamed protein product [Moneuplotes crassus]|uniref:Tetrapyrrole methylase domain-containing protein n=1 Tax=Euplotes crassus TaxID=5936 RepID=A0AAD1X6Z8_EUPCR|nr:unnamed protein product [Moneuplotes crassus]
MFRKFCIQNTFRSAFRKPVLFRPFCTKYTEDEGSFYYTEGDTITVTDTMPKYGGSLVIVPTPIGNLKDMSLRQYEALTSADIIACEDTRTTGKLLELIKERKIQELFRTNLGAKFDNDPSDTIFDDIRDTKSKQYQTEEFQESMTPEEEIVQPEQPKTEYYRIKTHDITGLDEKYEKAVASKTWWPVEDTQNQAEQYLSSQQPLSLEEKEEYIPKLEGTNPNRNLSKEKRDKFEEQEVRAIQKYIKDKIRLTDTGVKLDDQGKRMLTVLQKELEMNTFSNFNTFIENPQEFDEKLAKEVEKEFYKKVEDSVDYENRKNMILQISDRLRQKIKAKVQEELILKSNRLDSMKGMTWKQYKASGKEQDLNEPFMGQDDHYSQWDTESGDNDSDDFEDEYNYGLESEFTQASKSQFDKIKAQKGRGMLISLYEHNEDARIPRIIRAMKFGMKVALVSEAGTPTISDPGYRLVNECYNKGISIESLPGPSASLVAAAASGLITDRFIFEGYLSKTQGRRINTLKYLNSTGAAAIIFENPKRIQRTLNDIMATYGPETLVYIGTELTKMYEKNLRGTVDYLLEKYEDEEINLKGEATMVIQGKRINDKDMELKAKMGDLNREINVIDAISHIKRIAGLSEKQLRKIMKHSFHLNKHETKEVLYRFIHKKKQPYENLNVYMGKNKRLPDKFYDMVREVANQK